MPDLFQQLKEGLKAPAEASKAKATAADQLKDTIIRWQRTGDKGDLKYLLNAMKPTIASAISSFAPGQEARLAIPAASITVKALRMYDPVHGTVPQTYVFTALKRLNRENARRSEMVHTPEDTALCRKFLMDLSAKYEDKYGTEPSAADLADLSGYSIKKVSRLLDTKAVVSTSSTLAEDDQKSVIGTKDITDDDYNDYVYASCSNNDKKILEWSTGLHGKPILSGIEIAKRMRWTPAAVSQHKDVIRQKMSEVRGLL